MRSAVRASAVVQQLIPSSPAGSRARWRQRPPVRAAVTEFSVRDRDAEDCGLSESCEFRGQSLNLQNTGDSFGEEEVGMCVGEDFQPRSVPGGKLGGGESISAVVLGAWTWARAVGPIDAATRRV